jgi:hypothetical protein
MLKKALEHFRITAMSPIITLDIYWIKSSFFILYTYLMKLNKVSEVFVLITKVLRWSSVIILEDYIMVCILAILGQICLQSSAYSSSSSWFLFDQTSDFMNGDGTGGK